LVDFVELPDDGRAQDELWYSSILCGILRGALEMVSRFHRNSTRRYGMPNLSQTPFGLALRFMESSFIFIFISNVSSVS
jgi:hypothetical protein